MDNKEQELLNTQERLRIVTAAHNNLIQLLTREQQVIKWHHDGEYKLTIFGKTETTKLDLEALIHDLIADGYHIKSISPIEMDETGAVVKAIIIAIIPIDSTELERL